MKKKKELYNCPKVSIITCVYNGEKYISKLLDSVLNMGYPNIEHIIVNDGSTDSTEDIVMKYAELYKNKENSNLYIKYIKQENMGLGGATNTGLKQITGEYWTWINCDDWYEKNAFLYGIKRFNNNTDIVVLKQFVFDGKNLYPRLSEKIEKSYRSSKNIIKDLFGLTYKQHHYLVRTIFFDFINPNRTIDNFKYNQDLQLSYTLFPNAHILYEEKAISIFYYRNDSLLSTGRENIDSTMLNDYDPFFERAFASAIKSFDYLHINEPNKKNQILVFRQNYYIKLVTDAYHRYGKNASIRTYVFIKNVLRNRKNVSINYRKYIRLKYALYIATKYLLSRLKASL